MPTTETRAARLRAFIAKEGSCGRGALMRHFSSAKSRLLWEDALDYAVEAGELTVVNGRVGLAGTDPWEALVRERALSFLLRLSPEDRDWVLARVFLTDV